MENALHDFIHSLRSIRKLTRSLRSLVRFLILLNSWIKIVHAHFPWSNLYTPNANMADHSVGAQDELHESEASEASVFCFGNASLKNIALWTV